MAVEATIGPWNIAAGNEEAEEYSLMYFKFRRSHVEIKVQGISGWVEDHNLRYRAPNNNNYKKMPFT